MIQMLKEIFEYRDLLWMLTFRDIRIRYKQAAMGFLWAIFMPLVAVLAGILIKKVMAVMIRKLSIIKGSFRSRSRSCPGHFSSVPSDFPSSL